eukprot:213648_1
MASLSYALTVTIAALITQFGHHKCETIDTYVASQFSNSIINCFSTENCTVICDETGSCFNANIYCPKNHSCDIHCTAPFNIFVFQGACQSTAFHCPTEATCTINCGGDFSCAASVFNCPSNANCNVICDGDFSCDSSVFNCPTNASCNVICDGTSSCWDAHINWRPGETGTISCNGEDSCDGTNLPIPSPNIDFELICNGNANVSNETFDCYGAIVTCPTHASCHITCFDTYCNEMDIMWSPHLSINATLICDGECEQTTRPPIYVDDDTDLYLNCDTHSQCYGAVIYCPKYAECHISCSGAYSCADATFIWPHDHAYSLSCIGSHSCENTEYTPYSNDQALVINCNATEACRYSVIHCPKNAPCTISCSGTAACSDTVFHCPDTSSCNVQCVGDSACADAIFDGNGVLSCSGGRDVCSGAVFPVPPATAARTFICDQQDGCSGAIIHCPSGAYCKVLCNGSSSCTGARIHWPTQTWPSAWGVLSCPGTNACDNIITGDHDSEVQKYYTDCINREASCQGATIIASDDSNALYIDCSADTMCKHSTIICPLYAECIVLCSGWYSCYKAIIYGPNNHELHMVCGGTESCQGTWIYAQNSSCFTLDGVG